MRAAGTRCSATVWAGRAAVEGGCGALRGRGERLQCIVKSSHSDEGLCVSVEVWKLWSVPSLALSKQRKHANGRGSGFGLASGSGSGQGQRLGSLPTPSTL
jgi:hypothetical protein